MDSNSLISVRRMINWPGNQKGYSLLEAVIAIAIFSVGLLTVGTMIISTTNNNAKGNLLTEATMLARGKIEELRRVSNVADLDLLVPSTETNIDHQGNANSGIYNRTTAYQTPDPSEVKYQSESRVAEFDIHPARHPDK